MPEQAASPGADWPSATKGWLAVIILMLAYVISFVDRQILTLLVPAIKADLGLSDTRISLLQGLAFGLFYTSLGLFIGRFADRANRRNIIAAGMTLWCLMTIACGFSRNFWQLFAARVGVGVGEATLNPAALSILSDYFPPERRALPISVFVSAASLGSGLALMIGGGMIAFADSLGRVDLPLLGSLAGWQLVFVIVGLAGLPFVLLVMLLGEPVRRGVTSNQPASWRDLRGFLAMRRPLFLPYIGGFALFSMLVYGQISWAPSLFIRSFGWTPAQVGLAYGAIFLIAGVGGSLVGGVAAATLRRMGYADANMRTVAIGVTAIIPFAVVAPLAGNAPLALALFAVSTFFIAFPSGVSAAIIQDVTPNQLRSQMTAIYYLAINLIGLGLGALSIAILTDNLFSDEARLGSSMAITAAILGPIASILIWSALPRYARLQTAG